MGTRRRRPAAEARQLILATAEELMIDGGLGAVQVRVVARRIGVTDAAVYHHYGTRDELLVALLRHGGRRLRTAVAAAADAWLSGSAAAGTSPEQQLRDLVERIWAVYADGYGELAIALHASGWRDPEAGLLDDVVEVLQRARTATTGPSADISDTRLAVAALHQALAIESSYGPAFRRSAGLAGPAAVEQGAVLEWWVKTLTAALGLDQATTRAAASLTGEHPDDASRGSSTSPADDHGPPPARGSDSATS